MRECREERDTDVIKPDVRGDLTSARNGWRIAIGVRANTSIARQLASHLMCSPELPSSARLSSTNPIIRSPSSAPSALPFLPVPTA
jgi:hypothetical protein